MKPKFEELFFSMTYDYLHVFLAGIYSANTVDAYKDALTAFRRYLTDLLQIQLAKFTFSACTFDLVLCYRNWMLEEAKLAAATANHRLAAIRSYLGYAASRDVAYEQISRAVKQVPFAKIPIVIQPVIGSEDALRALFNAPPNTPTGRRDTVILCVLYDTAIRADELTAIRLADMHLDGELPHILIHGKGSKERVVTVSEKTCALLKSYIDEVHNTASDELAEHLIFTKSHGKRHRMSVRNVERIVQKYADIARSSYPEMPINVSPHTLRRTRGTQLYQNGTPVEMIATLLGHASTQTTMDHYATPSMEQKKKTLEKGDSLIPTPEIPEWPENNEEFARLCGLR